MIYSFVSKPVAAIVVLLFDNVVDVDVVVVSCSFSGAPKSFRFAC